MFCDQLQMGYKRKIFVSLSWLGPYANNLICSNQFGYLEYEYKTAAAHLPDTSDGRQLLRKSN